GIGQSCCSWPGLPLQKRLSVDAPRSRPDGQQNRAAADGKPRPAGSVDRPAKNRPDGGLRCQLKLLGSVTRPPRPRRRVPGRTASEQGAVALNGTATISTSLSGPAPVELTSPENQKGRVTSLHNHHGP